MIRGARLRRAGLGLVVVVAAIIAVGYATAVQAPVVVRYTVPVAGLRAPLTVAVLSDIHVCWPDMPPARVAQLAALTNSLHPDLIALTGDYVSDKLPSLPYSTAASIAPLAGLRAPLGVFAVVGNHDHWRGLAEINAAFAATDIVILRNTGRRAGPIWIAGVDDAWTATADPAAALRGRHGQPALLLSHNPDIFPEVPADVVVTFAGHTHGGQIVLPFVGALATASRFGSRYRRGAIAEAGHWLVVSAGLGTSLVPLRFGTRPEILLVTLAPAPIVDTR
jgi:uncharacterized protein